MLDRVLIVSGLTIGLAAAVLIPGGTRFNGHTQPANPVDSVKWTTGTGPSSSPARSPARARRSGGGTVDVNCDGIDDIVLQNAAGWIGVFIMNGTASPAEFRYIYPGNLVWKVVGTGDLNNDGVADLLVQNPSNWIGGIIMGCTGLPVNFIYVYPGDTGGWLVSGMTDLNNDNIADIVLQNASDWIGGILMNGSGVPTSFYYVYPGSTGGWDAKVTGD